MVGTGRQRLEKEREEREAVSEETSLGIQGGSWLKASWVVSLLFQLLGSLDSHQKGYL